MHFRRGTTSLFTTAFLIFVLTLQFPGVHSRAQSGAHRKPAPAKAPTPAAGNVSSPVDREAQDSVKVFTEEVRIPVFAYDEHGRFDPTLELDDILVIEDDVPQQVKSVRHIPASVLLLVGTGNELNPAMRTATTRDIALNLVAKLREGDSIAALQFNNRTELLQDWTLRKEEVARALRSKLVAGKGSALSQAFTQASRYLQKQPIGNRHLVLITDGVENASKTSYQEAARQLIATQATVHVISYSSIGQKALQEQNKNQKEVIGMAQSRADIATVGIDPTRPPGMIRDGVNPPRVNGGIRFDPELKRRREAYEREMKKGEERLASLAEETAGRMWLPATTEEMLTQGSEVAREIGTQYVVTYTPKRPLASAAPADYRRLTVAPRRLGLQLRARRGYVVAAMR